MLEELIKQKEKDAEKKGYIEFTNDELSSLSEENALEIERHFHGNTLMKLPECERVFFNWLKKVDQSVWEDLWGEGDNPYFVSTDFLHHFIDNGNGFPICDLVEQDNYWFNEKHTRF